MKKRKIPMRMCVGCREAKPKKEPFFFVFIPVVVIYIVKNVISSGLGAFLCFDINCLEKAIKHKLLERALDVNIDPQIYDTLKSELMEEHES